jgi:cathepsin B
MKAIVFAALCVVFVSCELVDMGTWVADTNNKFAGMSMEELRQYVGTYVTNFSDGEVQPTNPNVPKTFDPTTDAKWGQTCVHPIRNQGQCGSCWAFGLSESFSDRVCVATFSGTVENVVLSPENLVSCDTENYGCSGGYLNLAW